MVRKIEDWESKIFIDIMEPLEENPEMQKTILRIKELVSLRKKDLLQWSDSSLYDLRQSVIDRLIQLKIITPDDSDISLRSDSVTPEQMQYIADICAINEILYEPEGEPFEDTETAILVPWKEVRFGEIYHMVHLWKDGEFIDESPLIKPAPIIDKHEKSWYSHSLKYDHKKVQEIRERVITVLTETFHFEAIDERGFVFNPPLSPTNFNNALMRIAQLSGINRALRDRAKDTDLPE